MTRTKRLNIILFRAAYNLPITLGVARGVFARHGLALDIAYTRGSQMTCDALLDGERDLGVLAADDVVYEVERRGADLFMFMRLRAGILTLMARRRECPGSGRRPARRGRPGLGFRPGRAQDPEGDGALSGSLPDGCERRSRHPSAWSFRTRASRRSRARDYLPRYQASCCVSTRRRASERGDALTTYVGAYRDGLFPDAAIDVPGIQAVLALRVEAGLLKAPPPEPSRYYDTDFLR